nr:unnamed protein product [Naegleria fowleri]
MRNSIHKWIKLYSFLPQHKLHPSSLLRVATPLTDQIHHNFSTKVRWQSNNQESHVESTTTKTITSHSLSDKTNNSSSSSSIGSGNRTSNLRETFHHYASTIPSHLVRESSLLHHHQHHDEDNKPLDPKHPYGPDQIKVHEIKLRKQRRQLELHFEITRSMNDDDGKDDESAASLTLVGTLPAELLRVESPSAEVQGENGQKRLIYGKKFVQISQIETVGSYAIRLIFSDGHDSGIYSWSYLYEMARHKYSLMKQYIKDLRAEGKSRYPREYLKKMKDQQQQHQQ